MNKAKPQIRRQHTDEFRAEALQLASKVGVAQAAKELGLHASQIYQWRSAASKKANTSEREAGLAAENARLKREKAELEQEVLFLKKAAAYFAKPAK